MPPSSTSPAAQAERAAPASPAVPAQVAPAGGARHYLRVVGAIVWKDLAAELRSKELLSAMVVFSLLAIFIFNFALELNAAARREVAGGVLWVTIIFTGTLGLNRTLAQEKDRGSLDGLLLAPVDRSALYFGKMLSNLLFILIVEAIVLPVFSILFNINLLQPAVLLVVVLGAVGYSAVGTLLAALAVHTRAREVMLPILLFPIAVPLLIAGVRASSGLLAGAAWADLSAWVGMLAAYDVIFLAAALMLFDFVVED